MKQPKKASKIYRIEWGIPEELRTPRHDKTKVKFIEGIDVRSMPLYVDDDGVAHVIFQVIAEDNTVKWQLYNVSYIEFEVVERVPEHLKVALE